MKRLLTLLFFAFFAITTQAQTVPNLPSGSVPFGTGLFRAPDGDIWGGSKFDGYTNLGNWERVADSLGAKINWSDTTIIASKEWVEGKLNSLPPSGVLSVTGDGVDNTDPANPVLSYPDPSDIGALAPGDNVSELTNDAGYLDSETDPVYSGDPASSITQNDIDAWDDKQDAITGAATTVVSSNLTPSRALISNGSGKIAVSPVSSTELAFLDGVSSNVQDQLDAKIPLSQKGASNGVAPIGSDGKIPGEYLPSSGSYKGTWDASTNTPTIADGVGTNGDRYRVSVGGTVDLGSGPITFVAGDDVIYNGTVWQRSPSGVTVTSVAGKTGDVVLDKNDVGLGNVDNTSDMDKPISTAVQNALDLKLDASEIANYYTKTQMQTSGQSQMHWDNITNTPTTLSGYGITDGIYTNYSGTGSLANLAGGSGVDANTLPGANVFYAAGSGNPNFPTTGAFLSLRHPAGAGMQIQIRPAEDEAYFRGITNANEGTWYRFASREHTAANYLSTTPGVGGVVNIDNSDVFSHTTAGVFGTGTGAPNAPNNTQQFSFIQLYSNSNTNPMLAFVNGGSNYGSEEPYWTNRAGVQPWRQLASKPWVLSQNYLTSASLDDLVTTNTDQAVTGQKTFRNVIKGGLQVSSINGTNVLSDTYQGSNSILNIGVIRGSGRPFIGYGIKHAENGSGYLSSHTFDTPSRSMLILGGGTDGLLYATAPPQSTAVGSPITGLVEYKVWHEGNLNPDDLKAPETVVSTTVNFTIDWQNDTAPNSGGKTYAEVHGNHFTYSAFYVDGDGSEVNYSPAVKITRNGSGAITTVQFGDIQTGNIVIK